MIDSNIHTITEVKPYTPLELEGRDIYIREGCVGCHSQMIRPFRSEVERYGEYSKAGEFVYDHPFLWGSKRTGPDLHREGGLKSDSWHYKHMYDPRGIEEKSIMPSYPWLIRNALDKSMTQDKMNAMVTLGVPYSKEEIAEAMQSMDEQALKIVRNLYEDPDLKKSFEEAKKGAAESGETFIPIKDREITALIAYLQRLGTDIKVKDEQTTQN
jgi:cytochrome c oxidase cbb3-type subunit I/II